VFSSLDACLRDLRVDFVLTATPRSETPRVVAEAVDRGLPVLAETPPAPDLEGLRRLWSQIGGSGLVQVAEQYALMPSHAARITLVDSGAIGTPTQVQVSSTQEYHAVALIRRLLGAGRGAVTVRATRLTAPLVSPLGRGGWTDDEQPHPATTTIATLDFGQARSGLYDFTEQQTRNQLRFRRITVRGTAGELHNDEVVRMTGPRTLVRAPLVRRQTGHDLDLIGYDTEGPEPYPLAEGLQDQHVALAVEQAADADAPVTTSVEAWADH
jgi:predicted dehydrogenase